MAFDVKLAADGIWHISLALEAALLARLFWLGLWRKYFWFKGLLLFSVVRSLAVLRIDTHTNFYGYFWAATEVLSWFIYVACLRELYGLVLTRYTGIRTFSRRVLWVMLACAVALVVISMSPEWGASARQPFNIVVGIRLLSRACSSVIFVHLVLVTFFLVWFPVPLARNVIFHSFLFALYFLSKAFVLLSYNLGGFAVTPVSDFLLQTAGCVCLSTWLLAFSRHGEQISVVVGHRWNQEEDERLRKQLQNINAMLAGLQVHQEVLSDNKR